jgi:hypothetical protein
MKTYSIAIFIMAFSFLTYSQDSGNSVKLKQINSAKTNFRNLKSGEITNKTLLFKEGKLLSIQTSDVIQSFFYNPKELLDMTVKEKQGSNWKEVINYSYNKDGQLVKFTKKYEEGGEMVVKTVNITYEGSRVRAITKKSNIQQTFIDDIEYVVENGLIVRRASRDRNQQIVNKIEYGYYKDNIVRHKGLIGDKALKNYSFDDKNSVELLIAQNTFGQHYKVIVPIISFHEEEFDLESISNNNKLNFNSTSTTAIGTSRKFKYNTLNFPVSSSLVEENGIVKTETTYLYE